MALNAHDTLWAKLNTIYLRLSELGTDALLEGETELYNWTEKVSEETLAFLKNVRRYHHAPTKTP